jgi:hypothetical protein
MGLRVVEVSASQEHPDFGGYLGMRFEVTNISAEWQPPGWVLENAYLGVMADPDIGLSSVFEHWFDDHAAFLEADATRGDLAYMFDEPTGGGDDVDVEVGLLLPDQPAHAFRVWSWSADPQADTERYARMKGVSHDSRTIDPATTRANDYRILLSVGPMTIAPGASKTLEIALVCGDLSGTPRVAPERPVTRSSNVSTALRPVVAPNPVRLARAGEGVRFLNVPEGGALRVHSVTGRLVSEFDAAAPRPLAWDLRDPSGAVIPAGVYFYRVVAPGGGVETGRFVVLK